MRKQLAIGLSVFALTALGGASEDVLLLKQGVHHNTTHLVETSQNQTFEPKSRASLMLGLPNYFDFQIAAVQSITGGKKINFGKMEFEDQTIVQCKREGYNEVSCISSYWLAEKCPYNSSYYKKCCSGSYKYLASECTPPRTISSDSCGGKYKCSCSTTTYPYTSSNCKSPKVLSGETCTLDGVTRYSQCSCPTFYSQTCSGTNQQGSGTGCTENGVTKYTSCQCKSGYNLTCLEWGPTRSSDYCLLNGIKHYNSCKTCSPKDCSAYTLKSAPVNANYTTCSPGCYDNNTYYQFTSCKTGFRDLDNYWCNGAMHCWFK